MSSISELTKSINSAISATTLFTLRQSLNVLKPGEMAKSLNAMAQAAANQSGDTLRETFHATDRFQRGMVDAAFRLFALETFTGNGGTSSFSNMASQATDWMTRTMGGDCGCSGKTKEQPTREQPTSEQQTEGWGPVPPQ